jgi:hypothetical protein
VVRVVAVAIASREHTELRALIVEQVGAGFVKRVEGRLGEQVERERMTGLVVCPGGALAVPEIRSLGDAATTREATILGADLALGAA